MTYFSEFDIDKPLKPQGTLVKSEIMNPHPDGEVVPPVPRTFGAGSVNVPVRWSKGRATPTALR